MSDMFFLSDDESFFLLGQNCLFISQCQSIISKNQRGAVHFGESIKIPGKFLRSAARSIIAGTNVPIYSRNWFILQCCRNCKCKALRTTNNQSQKKPSAHQQCWPESFCESGKFLQQAYYLLENFRIFWKMSGYCTKYPDNMQSVWMNWKVSGWSKKCRDELESFHMM